MNVDLNIIEERTEVRIHRREGSGGEVATGESGWERARRARCGRNPRRCVDMQREQAACGSYTNPKSSRPWP